MCPVSGHQLGELTMSSVQIGLLMLLGISSLGFITLAIDLLRARRMKQGK